MYSFYSIYETCKDFVSLTFHKRFDGDNAQGSCGVLKLPSQFEPKATSAADCREIIHTVKNDRVFYKYGNIGHNCTLARQEFVIAQNLLLACSHLPNFMRPIIYLKNHFIRNDKCIDPFSILKVKDKNNISCVDITIFEYIKDSVPFNDMLKKENKSVEETNEINSLVMQIIIAVLCAQQNAQFTHNDLHSNNILIVKCKPSLKILYRLKINGKESLFVVPTFGNIPIIIDFGFSYSKECEGMSLECIDSDNYGLITYKFDSISDFIRLFVVLCSSNYNEDLSKKIKSLFDKLPISFKSSWEKIVNKESSFEIEKVFSVVYKEKFSSSKSPLRYQLFKLMLRNVILPLSLQQEVAKYSLETELTHFFNCWIHIDKWFSHDYEKVFVFRELYDIIRKTCNLKQNITTEHVRIVSGHFATTVFNVTNKNIPVSLDWGFLIRCINRITGIFQNVLFEKTKILDSLRKQKLYKTLISGEQMFEIVKSFLYKEKVLLNDKDLVLFIDNISKSATLIQVELKDQQKLNAEDVFNMF